MSFTETEERLALRKAVAKLAFWAMASDKKDVAAILVEGIAAAPPDFVDSALDRMETMREGLFWEVNERVVAFDWVEEPLRAQIPHLRKSLSQAKASPVAAVGPVDSEVAGAKDLVKPQVNVVAPTQT